MDEVLWKFYPVVSFAEGPTCPPIHPHLGSSGPVKHKHRERGIWEENERRGALDELTDLIPFEDIVSPLASINDCRGHSKWHILKKPPGSL